MICTKCGSENVTDTMDGFAVCLDCESRFPAYFQDAADFVKAVIDQSKRETAPGMASVINRTKDCVGPVKVVVACGSTLEDRFWEKVNKYGPIHPELKTRCWVWTAATDPDGYGVIGAGGIRGKTLRAHRLSYELANGPIQDGLCVLHQCDDPSCVRPDHLFLGTQRDNIRDRAAKGRHVATSQPGESNSRAKLTADDVREIRAAAAAGVSQSAIAKCHGVHRKTVWDIVCRNIWQSVP